MRNARSAGITGYVRNLPGGDVYIEAEGLWTDLNEFVSWCHEGPPHARVKSVKTAEDEWKGFVAFDITG